MTGCLYLGNPFVTQLYGGHDRRKALELRQECQSNNRKTLKYRDMESLAVLSRISARYIDYRH
jgi:hypothetical protein